MAAPSPKGLVVEGLSKTYTSAGGKVEALKGVSFSVPPGKVLGVLGPSGCGKTTLLRSIAGLEEPDEGTILLGERALWAPRRGIRLPPERREVGMVFQSYAIWPHMTVFENVAFPLRVRRRPEAEVRQRVGSVLEMVRLFGLENRPATDLSGGQQQRVALARALVAQPSLLLFDEPLSNLDAQLREATLLELRTFLQELGITAIYVTHDRAEALALADQILVMRDGRAVALGTPEEVYFHAEDPFVVGFVGRVNLLPGRLLGVDAQGNARVDLGFAVWSCAHQGAWPQGTPVLVAVRPEHFQVPASGNPLKGQVVSLVFTGEVYRMEVLPPGGKPLRVDLRATDLPQAPRVGDSVELGVGPRWCRVLASP
ncbi:MAG: ABC transporter ATP-binding protein [Thermus sp.]|nr:ABC transporter ATP-binding protein [Thermus sp.]